MTTAVRKFVIDNFCFGQDPGLGDDDSFLDKGIIDSTGVLELVAHLEKTHNIKVEDEELIPDNLDSVNRVGAYLKWKLAASKVVESRLAGNSKGQLAS